MDAVRAAQQARIARLAPPPPVAEWYPARREEPEPEPEEESIFGLNLTPPPVVALPSSDTSHQLAMRAQRQRQAAVDAAGASLWSLVTDQLSDPATTALLHDLMAAAGIQLADSSAGEHGPVPRAEFGPGDTPDDETRQACEAWRRVADEMARVLELATDVADAEATRREIEERYEELQQLDPRELNEEEEDDRQAEMQELSDAMQPQADDAAGGSGGPGQLLLNGMLVFQQAVASMSSLEREGRPACAPQAMRAYKMLQTLYERARTLHAASRGM
jgi:hypothetical protein